MKIQQPSFIVLFFLLFLLDVIQAQTLERSSLYEQGLKRYSRERRKLHRHHSTGSEEDHGSSSHHHHHNGHHHGRKSDKSSVSKSHNSPKGHSKSWKVPPPPKSDSSKSKKKSRPMSHSSKSKNKGGPKSRSSKSQIGSEAPENGIKSMESRKDEIAAAAQARVAEED